MLYLYMFDKEVADHTSYDEGYGYGIDCTKSAYHPPANGSPLAQQAAIDAALWLFNNMWRWNVGLKTITFDMRGFLDLRYETEEQAYQHRAALQELIDDTGMPEDYPRAALAWAYCGDDPARSLLEQKLQQGKTLTDAAEELTLEGKFHKRGKSYYLISTPIDGE